MRGTRNRQRLAVALSVVVLALVASACGSRLSGNQAALAQGAVGRSGTAGSGTGTGAQALGSASTNCTSSSSTTTTTAASGSKATTTTTKPKATTPTSSTTTTTPCSSSGPGLASGTPGSGSSGSHPGASGTGGANPAALAGVSSGSGVCGANGNQAPAGGNGGATATGVTATTITVGNIASISGVAPGLTQSAQQATEAWAAYVNSTGGICGRQVKVQPFDDGNDSGQNNADASQACSSDFAMVGNASGFDDGGAQAVSSCGIPDMSAEVSTAAAGGTADIFGASPGNDHYWAIGPANYLKSLYPNAIQHAAMIYLQVPATQTQAAHEIAAYTQDGFKYTPAGGIPTTPTNANYGSIVQEMQGNGTQYVTEYSDDNSAERLLQAMQQANYTPQVVDWFSEEYSPQFAQQTAPESNGDLVLMSATAGYDDASSNPGLQLMESWLNRVAGSGNWHQDIFAILAWSAGLAFEQAAKQVGPDLTRPALISKIQAITSWTGGGITPVVNIGGKVPTKCFFYEKIENGAFQRVYPTAPNTYDCNSGYVQY
ncbi:MAG TPA: ABC transporter substrate-binding protein [Acidimicrobiales bacterium]|nr:ABC transporter substrate-binding protein [Acidimicrobiales bacterium]